ncbi:putative GCN5-related N-acetyltransferase [Streptococcus varani]|uniref:Putative GCN5-related N-acetyltransferase n=1 Tax=Streptococcus varani TaxID=1608583 RepID=A0A0E4H3F3_9STRE|nr:GNAT family N-acetyltransferase [Streptococcus varani]CQR24482.1 putative GCN5-related N-acetyltransferase [Streptococcus varani]
MKIQKISILSPHYKKVKKLYEDSFPAVERISWTWMLIMAFFGRSDFLAYFDKGTFAGFSYSLKSKHVYYLLFLAVPSNAHSRGYGGKILKAVAKQAKDRPIFLVIEPLDKNAENYKLRLKRLAFYEKNGYTLTDYLYFENEEVYQVLTNKNEDRIQEFEKLGKYIEWSGMKIRLLKAKN